MNGNAMNGRRMLAPLRHHAPWVASGLLLQATGVGGVAAYLWLRLRREGIGGHLTAATIRLAWHGEIHTRPGLAILIAGALIYAAGSIMVARPYVSRPATLFIAVPLAAVVGMLALGVLALVVTLLLVVLENGDFGIDFDPGDDGRDRRRRQ